MASRISASTIPLARADKRVKSLSGNVLPERKQFPYPSGWFGLCFSHDLRPGDVRVIPFMGSELVVYRTSAGVVHAVEPYCPHLGAHLGHGGKVRGENIVCPFHGLAFGPEGRCVDGGNGRKPPGASLSRWEVRERCGMVVVWRDSLGQAPDWEIPDLDMSSYSRGGFHQIEQLGYAHDIAENSADLIHFGWLHGFTDTAMTYEIDAHRMICHLSASWRGIPLKLRVTAYGIGYVVAEGSIARFGIESNSIVSTTPIGPLRRKLHIIDVVHVASIDRWPAVLRKLTQDVLIRVMHPWFVHLSAADLPIWKHRTYLDHPALTDGERPLAEFRRWMQQFYRERETP